MSEGMPECEEGAGDAGDRAGELLGSLLALGEREADPTSLAQSVLDEISSALGLSGALLSLAEAGDPVLLAPAAAVGPRAALTLGMPPVEATSDAEIAQVFTSGEPVFQGPAHDEPPAEADPKGVARWREGIVTSAHAVLPLVAVGRTLGTLALEWAEAQPFGDADRDRLSTLARATALLLAAVGGHASHEHHHVPPLLLGAVEVTDDGARVPVPPDGGWARDPAVRVVVAGRESPAACAFWDVLALAPGRVDLLCGIAAGPEEEAAAVAEAIRQTARAYLGQSLGPAEVVASLGESLTTWAPPGVAAAAFVGSLRGAALEWAAAGAVTIAVVGGEGRVTLAGADSPPLSASSKALPDAHAWLALRGDRLLVRAGTGTPLGDAAETERVREALAGLREAPLPFAAAAALDAGGHDGGLAAALALDVRR